jgi:hypothetical protein
MVILEDLMILRPYEYRAKFFPHGIADAKSTLSSASLTVLLRIESSESLTKLRRLSKNSGRELSLEFLT